MKQLLCFERDNYMQQFHCIQPFYSSSSKILILGSFPSVKSRETKFFYGHPQNRFWSVTSSVFDCETPYNIQDKKSFLNAHNIALWDVVVSCDINGSSDSSIKNVVENDLNIILDECYIQKIFLNGKTSERLYNKHIKPHINISAICLPSTSAANAAWSEERLIKAWSEIKNCL